VRRLRAKLGPEHESLIGTVRNVGYRFVAPEKVERAAEEAKAKAAETVGRTEDGADAEEAAVRPAQR
jgi:DNA-binding winged helix-turn-helix (wHTH) protein